jgi:hypothetical protein
LYRHFSFSFFFFFFFFYYTCKQVLSCLLIIVIRLLTFANVSNSIILIFLHFQSEEIKTITPLDGLSEVNTIFVLAGCAIGLVLSGKAIRVEQTVFDHCDRYRSHWSCPNPSVVCLPVGRYTIYAYVTVKV